MVVLTIIDYHAPFDQGFIVSNIMIIFVIVLVVPIVTKTIVIIVVVVIIITVEPVLSGPVLSGHPLLSGQLSKSRKLLPLITVILTSIKRSPLLSDRGHPLLSPEELFLLS